MSEEFTVNSFEEYLKVIQSDLSEVSGFAGGIFTDLQRSRLAAPFLGDSVV